MNKPLSRIASGIKKRGTEGVFSRAAHRAGKSTHEFAEEHKHSSGKIGNRARLALTFAAHRPK
jgi:hypothetical protein